MQPTHHSQPLWPKDCAAFSPLPPLAWQDVELRVWMKPVAIKCREGKEGQDGFKLDLSKAGHKGSTLNGSQLVIPSAEHGTCRPSVVLQAFTEGPSG